MARIANPRIAILGGTGHVGSYLVPSLIQRGYTVLNVSRGQATPYRPHPAWNSVQHVHLDRTAEEAAGRFGQQIADLHPDIVIDMRAFALKPTQQLVHALDGKIEHYLFCSTIWVYGPATTVPTTEAEPPSAIDAYGIQKAQIEDWLLHHARVHGFPATAFRPGHIVGEGWVPVNPQGHHNPEVFARIARGEEIVLPNLGLETLHHVHADDVAQWILCALDHRAASLGEAFNTVSPQALTLRGYAESLYRWFGHQPRIAYAPYDDWARSLPQADADDAWGHIQRSSSVSIEKSRQRLGYQPRYSSLEAIQQSLQSLSALIAASHLAAETHALS